jgi:RHS repeat-associated protein
MVLGSRGPRSLKVRLTTGLALVSTLFGPLRMAYGLPMPVPPTRANAPSPLKPGALPADGPSTLARQVRPARLSVLEGAADVAAVGHLFDRLAATGLTATGRVRFRADLSTPTYVDAVTIYGKAAGALGVEADGPKGHADILPSGAVTGGAGWNRRNVVDPVLATSLTFTFDPAGAGATLSELEIWGRLASAPTDSEAVPVSDAVFTHLPPGAQELRAAPAEQTVALSTVSAPGVGGTFSVAVQGDPRAFDRAFLVYELAGLPHFTAAVRAINGQRALGRFGVVRGAPGGLQVEEIAPASLRAGKNEIQFLPVDDHDPGSYRVRNLRIVVVPAGERALSDASARSWQHLRDGVEGTGWRAPTGKPAEPRDWTFEGKTQPWALDFRLPEKTAGALTVSAAGTQNGHASQGKTIVELDSLSPGWHRVKLDKLPATERLTLTLSAGREQAATLSEVAIEGSPLPADAAPRIAISYPLSGECVNHRVHVRGFVTLPGAELLRVNGGRVEGALGADGAFAVELAEKDVIGGNVVVEAGYADGTRVRRTVATGACVDRPPAVVANDGQVREPQEDVGAPYGVTIKAGKAASLSFGGASLEIPAGAVDKDVRLTIRPLPTKDVAALDPGMTNVTSSGQAFRFGPHGMTFKKPVRIALPYDGGLLPAGQSRNDVRTFYYSEALHRWEQVGLIAQNDGEMAAATEHFTDFINATIPMPEHPGTQSLNPTSLKDMKLGDPASGIAQIEPPAGSSTGAAHVRFPIELPPGRRGIQPELALAYSSEATNGWLGVGWSLDVPSVEVDTRFGAPKYSSDGRSEQYVLGGEQLVRMVDQNGADARPPGAPAGTDVYFRRRVEGRFDWIARTGTSPQTFAWKVTDKNGVVYTYGAGAGRLASPSGNIFRWHLESVTDPFGNTMTYEYRTASGFTPDANPNGLPWRQLYASRIRYTAGPGLAAAYSVVLSSSEASHIGFPQVNPNVPGMRADVLSSARGGFDVQTRELLDEIEVRQETGAGSPQTIRRYHLFYTAGDFGKTLLQQIGVYGPSAVNGSDLTAGRFYEHTLAYFPPEPHAFAPATSWLNVGSNAHGLTDGTNDSGGANAFVGIGPVGCPSYIGGGGGFSLADDAVKTTLADLNGDGLPDLVSNEGNVSFVRFADATRTSVQTTTVPFSIGDLAGAGCSPVHDSRLPIFAPTLPLGSSSQTTASVNIGAHLFGFAGGSATAAWTWGKEGQSFADFDGDGLPEVLSACGGSGVRVARTFYAQDGTLKIGAPPPTGRPGLATLTPGDVQFDPTDTGKSADEVARRLHPVSPLVAWTAPYAGRVVITGAAQRDPTAVGPLTANDPPGGTPDDGVVVAIDRATTPPPPTGGGFPPPIETSNLWTRALLGTQSCAPSAAAGCSGPPLEVTIKQNDRLYFHVDGGSDTHGDTTRWSPTISYSCYGVDPDHPDLCSNLSDDDRASPDEFGLPTFIYNLTQDFRTADPSPPPFYAHATGLVTITVAATGTTPKPLTLKILKNGVTVAGGVIAVPAGTTGPQTYTVGPIPVTAPPPGGGGSAIPDQLVVEANYQEASVDPNAFSLLPRVDYNQVCELDDPNASITNPICHTVTCSTNQDGTPVCQVDTTPPLEVKPEKVTAFPEIADNSHSNDAPASLTIPADGTYSLAGLLQRKLSTTLPVTLLVKSDQRPSPLFQATLDQTAIPNANLPQAIPAAADVTLTAGERITAIMEFQTPSDIIAGWRGLKVIWGASLTTSNGDKLIIPSTRTLPPEGDEVRLMGGFRGWTYGEWNADRNLNGKLSEIVLLSRPDDDHAAALLRVTPRTPRLPSIPSIDGIPADTRVISRQTPEGRQQFTQGLWLGAGPDSFITAGIMKPSRVGGIDPSRAALGGPDTLRKTYTKITGADANLVAGGGLSSGTALTQLDFLDLNGDRRPDSVAYDRASFYDDALGLYTPAVPLGMAGGGTLRQTQINVEREGATFGAAAAAIVTVAKPSATGLAAALNAIPSLEHSATKSRPLSDFLDVNGDGLPDHVAAGTSGAAPRVQINLGYGFAPEVDWPMPSTAPSGCDSPLGCEQSDTNSLQIGFAGLGGGIAYSAAVSKVQYLDVNGDGLPDRLTRLPGSETVSVDLNMGTYFAPESWGITAGWPSIELNNPVLSVTGTEFDALDMHETRTFNAGAGIFAPISFVVICLAIEFSIQIANANTSHEMRFEDVNGDGRPDQILKLQSSIFRSSTSNEQAKQIFVKLNQTTGKANLLKSFTRPLGGQVQIDYAREGNRVDRTLDPAVDMPHSQWVMSQVTVGDGRNNSYTQSYDYGALAANGTPAGFGSGFHERDEREDLGYSHVHMARSAVDAQGNQIGDGSQIDTFYSNQDVYSKGLLEAEIESDATGLLLRATTVKHATPPDALVAWKAGTDAERTAARAGSFFPAEQERRTLFYEKATGPTVASVISAVRAGVAPAAPKTHLETRQFDAEGNLTDLVDYGDDQIATDDLAYRMLYAPPTPLPAHITRATEIRAATPANIGSTSAFLRRRLASYNTDGSLATLTNLLSGGKVPASGNPGTTYNQASAIYQFTYDAFGNLRTFQDPTGYRLQYSYDSTAQTHTTRVDDLSFGYASTAAYDLRFGTIAASTDANGQQESLSYDTFGRLCTVKGPDDQTATEPTIAFNYGIVPSSCPNAPSPGATFPAYAVTRHKDVQHAGDPIDTVTFVDGLGRVIQTKKDIDRDASGSGTVTTGMGLSGQVLFDGRGRVRSQAQPGFISGAALTAFVVGNNIFNPTTLAYDELGRQTGINGPDGTPQGIQTTTVYGLVTPTSTNNLGDDRTWLLTSVTDPNGNTRHSYADARGRHVAVREFNKIGTATTLTTLTTKYAYDPLDELLSVTDAKGNLVSSTYDTLGQMITLSSPDTGLTEHRFDLAGNIKEKQSAVLRAANQTIKYVYDFNRLKTIDYPTSTDVTYTYGGPTEGGNTAGNLAGRIKSVAFDSGSELRFYDNLGNVREARTTLNRIATAFPKPSVTFNMKYTYDWLGRMQTMTFPNWIDQNYDFVAGEGEKVSYVYDRGGNIDRITGFQQTVNPQHPDHPRNFTYLSHIGYNEFEQRTVLTSGNGIANKYVYDAASRRLAEVNADSRGSLEIQQGRPATPFHRLRYTYDKTGNVTHMVNNLSVRPHLNAGVFVGPLDVTYTYDNLNQLRSMSGKYRPHVAYGYQYSDTFTYDELGNMKTKAASQDRLVWDNQTINTNDTNPVVTQLAGSRFDHNVVALTYGLSYTYPVARPHGATPVSETLPNQTPANRTYSYDANGNNTGNTFKGETRAQIWTEENRLKQVTRNGGSLAQFRYNDQGERTKKQTAAGDAWYVSQYFVLLPNNLPTKHIFAGETRIATKTDAIYMQTPTLNYYHPDHLGTTSYTTVPQQDLVQHERYFAFGELWRPGAEQEECDLGRPDNLRREWLFTSKEWDVDTGLYYFGARYFDPHADVWQSTDPVLGKYMRGEVNAGVFQPRNLGVYSYAWNNPVIVRDPSGAFVVVEADPRFYPRDMANHQRITAAGIGGSVSSRALAEITRANVSQDAMTHQGTGRHETAAHSMRSPGQSPREAAQLRDDRISALLSSAADATLKGDIKKARSDFGAALHTGQDSFATAHVGPDGPKEWKGTLAVGEAKAHVGVDFSERMGTSNVNAAVTKTEALFRDLQQRVLGGDTETGPSFSARYKAWEGFTGRDRR